MKAKYRRILYVLALMLLIIILPTGTPEDIPTTVLIISVFGWKTYLLLACLAIIFYMWARGDKK